MKKVCKHNQMNYKYKTILTQEARKVLKFNQLNKVKYLKVLLMKITTILQIEISMIII